MEAQNRVQWVYSSQNDKELAERYDQWAEKYDHDLENVFAYRGPRQAAEIFARYVPKDARVLDAGAGTGMVGEELRRLEYRNLVAMDISEGMLTQARSKRLYRELHQMVMGELLAFPTNGFGATICVGVLTLRHAPADSLDELVRVTQPGGYIVFTLRPDVYENNGFQERQAAFVSSGKWELADVTEEFQPLPRGEPDVYHQVWVYRVL